MLTRIVTLVGMAAPVITAFALGYGVAIITRSP
jgi:hypothetical protein